MKKNKLFRSAKLSNLEDEDLDILEKNKIFKIIDLRDPVEIEKAPDNLSSNLLKKYINLPISANTLSRMADAYHNCNYQENETIYENVMKKSYEFYLKNHSEVWKKFFTILLESNGKPVIYHCSAGKDRTGIASYLIQSLCSQKEELIFDKADLQKMNVLRRIIAPMGSMDAIEFINSKLKNTKNNSEFFNSMNKPG